MISAIVLGWFNINVMWPALAIRAWAGSNHKYGGVTAAVSWVD